MWVTGFSCKMNCFFSFHLLHLEKIIYGFSSLRLSLAAVIFYKTAEYFLNNINLTWKFLWLWYTNITLTILYSIHRPVFYLKHTVDNVLTSQETYYVYAKSLEG
jgi:hypothetical protein